MKNILLLLCIAMTPALNAAVITWGTVTTVNSADPTQVSTNGTLIDAVYMADGVNTTVNSVTFEQVTGYAASNSTISWTTAPSITLNNINTASTGRLVNVPSGNTNYDNIMTVGVFSQTVSSAPFWSLSGLTSGHTYEVQLWTPYWNNTFTQSYDSDLIVGGASGLLSTGNAGTPTTPQFVTGTFTADAASQNIYVLANPDFTFASAMQLRVTAVPEPSTAALIGVACLAGILFRKRRQRHA